MTAVAGILNRQGVALAADSAVTRTRWNGNTKCTKNGNKMIRLSHAVPISVMVTGNADFLQVPWDLIIRNYRDHRGDVRHTGVEEAIRDFFLYVADSDAIWEENHAPDRWLKEEISSLFSEIICHPSLSVESDGFGGLRHPAAFRRKFISLLRARSRRALAGGICPQFEDYGQDHFNELVAERVEAFFDSKSSLWDDLGEELVSMPAAVYEAIVPVFLETLRIRISTRCEDAMSAMLVFAGFGDGKTYPEIVAVNVCEGFDRRVNYHIRPEDIVRISESEPVAIRTFAQTDVADALLSGFYFEWLDGVRTSCAQYMNADLNMWTDPDREWNYEPIAMEQEIDKRGLGIPAIRREADRFSRREMKAWENALKDSDVRALAELAELLIALTGFQRILTFEQEGVGGLIDVAVITRQEGFTWLNRKGWYDPQSSRSQRFGALGI